VGRHRDDFGLLQIAYAFEQTCMVPVGQISDLPSIFPEASGQIGNLPHRV